MDRSAAAVKVVLGSLAIHVALVCALAPLLGASGDRPPPAEPIAVDVVVAPPPVVAPAPPVAAPPVPVIAPAPPHRARRAPAARPVAPAAAADVASSGTEPSPGSGSAGGGGDGSGTGSGGGVVTRAVPLGGHRVQLPYTREALEARIAGDVLVRLVVDPTGVPRDPVVVRGLGHGLDAIALALAAELRFAPARDARGQAVASAITWRFHFTPPREAP